MFELMREYRYHNRHSFSGRLPDVAVEWSDVIPEGSMAAAHVHGISRCYVKYCGLDCKASFIRIHPLLKYFGFEREAERSLLHEMVHIEGLVSDPRLATHTPQFNARIRELVAAGAFDGLL